MVGVGAVGEDIDPRPCEGFRIDKPGFQHGLGGDFHAEEEVGPRIGARVVAALTLEVGAVVLKSLGGEAKCAGSGDLPPGLFVEKTV